MRPASPIAFGAEQGLTTASADKSRKVNYGRATAMERAAEAQRAYQRAMLMAAGAPGETTAEE